MVTALQPSASAFNDIGAAGDATVEHDIGFASRGLDHFGNDIDGASAMIELPPAVIRNVNDFNTMIDGDFCVFRRRHALEDKRHASIFLIAAISSQVNNA